MPRCSLLESPGVTERGLSLLHEILVNLRLRKGWTQEELSERSGVSVRTIRNLETGKVSNPRRASLRLLSSVLDPGEGTLLQNPPHSEVPLHRLESRAPHGTVVGREEDLGLLASVLREKRLVILVGPGGVGKSTLALALVEAVAAVSGDGVSVVGLGDVLPEEHDAQRAFDRVAAAVMPEVEQSPRVPSRLVVLDNAEHVAGSVARLAKRLLADHPDMRLIITSRLRPPLNSAFTWEVTPLSVECASAAERVPAAARLFLQRASVWFPQRADAMDLRQVKRLCHMLDGIPRHLEFAAERLRSVALNDLLVLLEDDTGLQVLGSADESLLPHQRDVTRSVEWSLALLDPALRRFLTRLAHFSEDFLLPDLESLPSLGAFSRRDLVHLLAQLADHSLVQVQRGDEYRYRLAAGVRCVLLNAPESELLVEQL